MNRGGKLLCFGHGGHSIEFGGGSRLSGYDRPETFCDWDDVVDGCQVLDKREAVQTDEGYRWVFRGPMVNVDIADDEIDRCPDVLATNIMVRAMVEAGSQYGSLAALQLAHNKPEAGPLDRVSTAEYVAGWVARGARHGIVRNREIVWFS